MNLKSVTPVHLEAEALSSAAPDFSSQQAARSSSHRAPASHRAFVPLLLASAALTLTLGWQTHLLLADRAGLQAAHLGQQQTVDNAGKLRSSLDTLASDTQRLADTGNASAALLVAELRKRGVTINSQAGAAPAAAAKP